ncbi:MAG: DEAD/DEAH box helicase [Mycobacteriaceae bacterium]
MTNSVDPDSENVQSCTFVDLGLPPVLIQALNRMQLYTAFPIQQACIPDVLIGKDVLGRGPTGSGKTLAFGLPMLVSLSGAPSLASRPRGLILVPTRELAAQVDTALQEPARSLGLRVGTVMGGIPTTKQVAMLKRGIDLLVATPGRLSDLLSSKEISLDDIIVTTIDEADQMSDFGFLPQVISIIDQSPTKTQRLLFSATLDADVDYLVERYLREPVLHSIAPTRSWVSSMEHHLFYIEEKEKFPILAEISSRAGRTILFARTRFGVERITQYLRSVGVAAEALHGDKTQNARTHTLASFANGNFRTLVATNVMARGIHVDHVSLVVHVDPPLEPKDYIHRAGRTARAGERGVVVTLVNPNQQKEAILLLKKAGVSATTTRVTQGDSKLHRITGSRIPSGIPIAEIKKSTQTPKHGAKKIPIAVARSHHSASTPTRRKYRGR